MKVFGKVAILLFLIILLVIISSIQKLQEPPQLYEQITEGYTNSEEMTPDIESFLSEGEELDEINQKMFNMSSEELSSMLLSDNETN